MSVDWSALPPPQPHPDFDTAGFWQSTSGGTLAICRCQRCGYWLQPPLERCRKCEGVTAFEPVSGLGSIYTYIVQRQPAVVGFFDQVPYTVALVELDEQSDLRLPGRVVGIDPDDVAIGLRVAARMDRVAGGDFKVPVWHPIT